MEASSRSTYLSKRALVAYAEKRKKVQEFIQPRMDGIAEEEKELNSDEKVKASSPKRNEIP